MSTMTRQQAEGRHATEPAPDRKRQMLRELLDRIDITEAVRRRAVQQAISDALPETWRRRAQDFRAAAPKPGDYPGQANLSEVAEHGRECFAIARACEAHAALLAEGDPWATYKAERDQLIAEFAQRWEADLASLITGNRPPVVG
jgi:hypothetical protein